MTPLSPTNPGCLLILFFSAFLGLLGLMVVPATSMEVAPDITVVTVFSSEANADVTYVIATQTGPETWTFDVTVAHPDTGWDDYADGWDVILPDGSPVLVTSGDLFTYPLTHPHDTEQPVTRSQSGIVIPADVTTVTVRAHDLVDGWGGREVIVDLTAASGMDFEVIRQ